MPIIAAMLFLNISRLTHGREHSQHTRSASPDRASAENVATTVLGNHNVVSTSTLSRAVPSTTPSVAIPVSIRCVIPCAESIASSWLEEGTYSRFHDLNDIGAVRRQILMNLSAPTCRPSSISFAFIDAEHRRVLRRIQVICTRRRAVRE